jgi:hypothetical protein
MSTHQAEVINYKALGDGTIVVTARCCGDALTDSNHTNHDLANIDSEIDAHLARVSALHGKRLAAEEIVKNKIAASAAKSDGR